MIDEDTVDDPGVRPAATALPASVERYLAFLDAQRRLATLTLASYRRDLAALQRFATGDPKAVPIERLSSADVRRFAGRMHAGGLGARSIAHALSTWRGYYRWLAEREGGAANPVADVRAPKRARRLPKALSETMTGQLLDTPVANDDEPVGLRDAAIRELLYSSGLRLAELVALDVAFSSDGRYRSKGWIDRAERQVQVTGKGGKERTVPVGAKALDAIDRWLAVRGAWVRADPHPLFLSTRGERLSGRSIQTRLKAHAQAAGVPAHVHPHMLRHSFASHLLQASGDLRAVQELMGHASIASTQVYTSLDFQRLSAVYDLAHPRARRK